MASEMFRKNQVDVSITIFSYIYHILAVDEFVAIAFVYSTVEEQREQTTTELLRRNLFVSLTDSNRFAIKITKEIENNIWIDVKDTL